MLAGETVPWSQIPQDHLLLGSMTATELIEAGIVQVNPAFIGGPAITHVGLTLRSRENGEGEWRSPVATAGGAWLLASG